MEGSRSSLSSSLALCFNPICSLDHCGSLDGFMFWRHCYLFQSYLFVGSLWKCRVVVCFLKLYRVSILFVRWIIVEENSDIAYNIWLDGFNPICSLDHCGRGSVNVRKQILKLVSILFVRWIIVEA